MGAPKGNQNAVKPKLVEDALKRALARLGGDIHKGLDKVADSLVLKASEGDMQAMLELHNRLDGKSVQSIEADVKQDLQINVVRFADNTPE